MQGNEAVTEVCTEGDDDLLVLCDDLSTKVNVIPDGTNNYNNKDIATESDTNDIEGSGSNSKHVENEKINVEHVHDHDSTGHIKNGMRLICDLGYGIPKEARPRKEKLLAIAKQLVNFLIWQQQSVATSSVNYHHHHPARLYIVLGKTTKKSTSLEYNQLDIAKNDNSIDQKETIQLQYILIERIREVWNQQIIAIDLDIPFPENCIIFIHEPLHIFLQQQQQYIRRQHNDITESDGQTSPTHDTIYLSPDATSILDISKVPPTNIVVGLLIDRRTIQYNRSVLRALENHIPAARWPLEECCCYDDIISSSTTICTSGNGTATIHKNEPLNVDCVLEGMQQWYWNVKQQQQREESVVTKQSEELDTTNSIISNYTPATVTNIVLGPSTMRETFIDAATQALRHHYQRHPQRPLHKSMHDK